MTPATSTAKTPAGTSSRVHAGAFVSASSARWSSRATSFGDGGTESGTIADYQPVFNAVSRSTGIKFDLKVAQSYGAVVEAMCGGRADVAFMGPVTYLQAQKRGCAKLLAVGVENGQSV